MISTLKSDTVRFGVKMFLAIGTFFLLIYAMGWAKISELRYFNLLFVGYFSYKLAQANSADTVNSGYLRNLASLFGANALNVVLCMLGLVAFNAVAGIDFAENISPGILLVETHSLTQVMIALFLEGIAGAATVSFLLMQYFKNVRPTFKPFEEADF